jgi:hypothetical protein
VYWVLFSILPSLYLHTLQFLPRWAELSFPTSLMLVCSVICFDQQNVSRASNVPQCSSVGAMKRSGPRQLTVPKTMRNWRAELKEYLAWNHTNQDQPNSSYPTETRIRNSCHCNITIILCNCLVLSIFCTISNEYRNQLLPCEPF